MNLIGIISAAIAAVFGYKNTIAELREALRAKDDKLAEQAAAIEALKAQNEQDALDDAALEQAATEARAAADAAVIRTQELEQVISGAETEAAKLAEAINDHPDTPVISEDFTVESPAPTA